MAAKARAAKAYEEVILSEAAEGAANAERGTASSAAGATKTRAATAYEDALAKAAQVVAIRGATVILGLGGGVVAAAVAIGEAVLAEDRVVLTEVAVADRDILARRMDRQFLAAALPRALMGPSQSR